LDVGLTPITPANFLLRNHRGGEDPHRVVVPVTEEGVLIDFQAKGLAMSDVSNAPLQRTEDCPTKLKDSAFIRKDKLSISMNGIVT
jgi:hypothetical protein